MDKYIIKFFDHEIETDDLRGAIDKAEEIAKIGCTVYVYHDHYGEQQLFYSIGEEI